MFFVLDNKKTTNREQSAGNKNTNQERVGNKTKNNTGNDNNNNNKGKKEIYNNKMENTDKRY